MAVDGRAGEILARIDAIVRADGAALAAMMPRPPGKTAAERAMEKEAEAELSGRSRHLADLARGARRAS